MKFNIIIGFILLLACLNKSDYFLINGGYWILLVMQCCYFCLCYCLSRFYIMYLIKQVRFWYKSNEENKKYTSFVNLLLLNLCLYIIMTLVLVIVDRFVNRITILGFINNFRISLFMYNMFFIILKKDISNVVLRYSNNESYDIDNISNEQEDLNKEINQNDIIYNRSKSKQVKKKENITNNVFKNRG